jgi:uncharacterized membrane-anchored protein YhcB (DUF1043 family)
MSDWLLFVIGLILGSMIGMMLSAILTSGKISDLYSEIGDLRVQRKLLKEEIQKIIRRAKPKPRKQRIR